MNPKSQPLQTQLKALKHLGKSELKWECRAPYVRPLNLLATSRMKESDYSITRLYVNLNPTVLDTGATLSVFTVQIPNAIDSVVFMDLLNATAELRGLLIQIEDWGLNSTSNGLVYWRYVDDGANQRSTFITENVLRTPTRLRTLKVYLYETNGTPHTLSSVSGFELEIYCRNSVSKI